MADSLFTFTQTAAFPIPAEGQAFLTLSIDAANGALRVHLPDGELETFTLVDAAGNVQTQALFVQNESNSQVLNLGSVTYARPGLWVEYFPINGTEFTFRVSASDGGIGILDVRDIARQLNTHYHFNEMPVELSLQGNHLVVKTLQRIDSDILPPWYEQD